MIRFCRGCGEAFETDRDYHRFCWTCYWDQRDNGSRSASTGQAGGKAEAAPAGLDERFLRDAIQLCHPDRHDPSRFKVANAVTATLLELLNRQRGKR